VCCSVLLRVAECCCALQCVDDRGDRGVATHTHTHARTSITPDDRGGDDIGVIRAQVCVGVGGWFSVFVCVRECGCVWVYVYV